MHRILVFWLKISLLYLHYICWTALPLYLQFAVLSYSFLFREGFLSAFIVSHVYVRSGFDQRDIKRGGFLKNFLR